MHSARTIIQTYRLSHVLLYYVTRVVYAIAVLLRSWSEKEERERESESRCGATKPPQSDCVLHWRSGQRRFEWGWLWLALWGGIRLA